VHHASLPKVLGLGPHGLAHHGVHVHESILVLAPWRRHRIFPLRPLAPTEPVAQAYCRDGASPAVSGHLSFHFGDHVFSLLVQLVHAGVFDPRTELGRDALLIFLILVANDIVILIIILLPVQLIDDNANDRPRGLGHFQVPTRRAALVLGLEGMDIDVSHPHARVPHTTRLAQVRVHVHEHADAKVVLALGEYVLGLFLQLVVREDEAVHIIVFLRIFCGLNGDRLGLRTSGAVVDHF